MKKSQNKLDPLPGFQPVFIYVHTQVPTRGKDVETTNIKHFSEKMKNKIMVKKKYILTLYKT